MSKFVRDVTFEELSALARLDEFIQTYNINTYVNIRISLCKYLCFTLSSLSQKTLNFSV